MQALVGEQLRTVSTSLRVVNSMPRNAERERARTLGTIEATMWELRAELTLASRGLEEPFFQLCCCFSFCSGGK